MNEELADRRPDDGYGHYADCGHACPCYKAGRQGWLAPFFTVDHHGNWYRIEHGNVAIDSPTAVTLVPIAESRR